jgi:glycerophosphoryl diester phosphodiesterase
MPRIVAHRGASKIERENTLEAFRMAKTLGADMVELDVRRTVDGVLIVHHDAWINGEAIITMRAEDLPSYVPSLVSALDTCDGMEVNIEIKNDPDEPDYDIEQWVASQVVALLTDRPDRSRMLISSFDRATIATIRRIAPGLKTGFLFVVPPLENGANVRAFRQALADEGHVAVHPNRHCVTADFVEAAHAAGLAVNVWTVDKPDELRTLEAMRVDALITNVPDLARLTLSA